jgi:hypothetical protein
VNLESAILAILSALPVPKIDAQEVNRIERLQVITNAIASAANRATCREEFAVNKCKPIAAEREQVAAELIELIDAETNLRKNVHENRCLEHQCDPVRFRSKGVTLIRHLAHSLPQIHCAPSWSKERCAAIDGATLEATTAVMWEATKMLQGGHGVCKSTAGAFAYYAGSRTCAHKSAVRRAVATAKIRGKLWALTHEASK